MKLTRFLTPCLLALGLMGTVFLHVEAQAPLTTRCMEINGAPWKLEVAQSVSEKRQGLMGRDDLASGHGMVFLYESPRPLAFWMKHCKIALDLLYFRAGKLVHLVASAPPCPSSDAPCPVYPSPQLADTVVELPAGSAQQAGLKLGDRLQPCPSTVSARTAHDRRKPSSP